MVETRTAHAPSETKDPDSIPSLVELVLTIFKSLGTLITGKVTLAQQEFSKDFGTVVRIAVLGLCGGVILILALGLAGAGLAFFLASTIGSTGGAFLIVAGIYLALGAILFLVAKARIDKMDGFLSESRADLKRDAEWLKNLT